MYESLKMAVTEAFIDRDLRGNLSTRNSAVIRRPAKHRNPHVSRQLTRPSRNLDEIFIVCDGSRRNYDIRGILPLAMVVGR